MDKDFKLCIDDECPSREDCFRYTAHPVQYGQAFFREQLRPDEDDKCEYYVNNKKRKKNAFHKKVKKLMPVLLCMLACVSLNLEAQGHRTPVRRVAPAPIVERPDYPRSVGVNLTMQEPICGAAAPWWSITCEYEGATPAGVAVEDVALRYNLDVVALTLKAHPWDDSQNWYVDETPIDTLFCSPLMDVIMFHPQYWGVTGTKCEEDEHGNWSTIPTSVTHAAWPVDWYGAWRLCGTLQQPYRSQCIDRNISVYEGMYKAYGEQRQHFIVTTTESDWDWMGHGCRTRSYCNMPQGYWAYDACLDGTLSLTDEIIEEARPDCECPDPDDFTCIISPRICEQCWSDCPLDCTTVACNQLRLDKLEWLLDLFNRRQKAAEEARAKYWKSNAKVWNNIELNFFGTRDWQFRTVACDVIPRMDSLPDSVSVSAYSMADDIEWALDYVHVCTGIPYERIMVSEVGSRITWTPEEQYLRIYDWIDRAFLKGVRLAFVWDLRYTEDTYDSGRSVVDPTTGEERAGMTAIRDLNEKWRVR